VNPLLVLALADEPPPAGLAAGRYAAPAWLIWLVAGLTAALAVGLLVLRARRAKQAPPGDRRP
jgi:hypothetical protein